jgi:flagellar protein FlaJ
MFFPLSSCNTLGVKFRGFGLRIFSIYPSIKYDLQNIGIYYAPENYCGLAFISALIWAILFSTIVGFFVLRNFAIMPSLQFLLPLIAFIVSLIFFILLFLSLPKSIAKGIAAKIDRELIFAMRDMMIQISSGIPIFTAIDNISRSNYSYISEEFRIVSNNVQAGSSLTEEIEKMAIRSHSNYLRKISWQLVTAIRSGADLVNTLKGIVRMLVEYQFSLAKSFTSELNFIILVYLMAAAVLPTIGITVLVIFSVFGMLGITPEVFTSIVGLSFLGQIIIIAYVKFRRPMLFE